MTKMWFVEANREPTEVEVDTSRIRNMKPGWKEFGSIYMTSIQSYWPFERTGLPSVYRTEKEAWDALIAHHEQVLDRAITAQKKAESELTAIGAAYLHREEGI
jgi:hypothetical protein